MKALALLPLIAAASLVSAQQDSPTIKGHKIGESFNEYLVIENGSAENAARMMSECADLLKNRKRRHKEYEICNHFGEAIRGLTVTFSNYKDLGALREFQFASTRLVEITMAVAQDFAAVESDLIAKFGRPDREEQTPYQNGFGAVFVHPSAFWTKRSDVYVTATEDATATPTYKSGERMASLVNLITIVIIDRSHAEALAAEKERQRPNSVN